MVLFLLSLLAQDESALARFQSTKPRVQCRHAGAPGPRIVFVLVEERLLRASGLTLQNGSGVLERYLADLKKEGWHPFAYSYDVRSHETSEQAHRHLPSEVLELYRTLRSLYRIAPPEGVVLIGDFPAAGVACLADVEVNGKLEQHEMDYFGVDAMLADPLGYWEWLPVAPMVTPGSQEILRLPQDEGRHPNGQLYPRDEWSAPAFVIGKQWEVHHSQRKPKRFGAVPQYWVGRISAAQAAWRIGPKGWEYSFDEELRLLTEYFDRNHAHRTTRRKARGYLFLDQDFSGGWTSERDRMAAAVPDITVHADASGRPAADMKNFLASFREDYLLAQYVMHSDWLNHYFAGEAGSVKAPQIRAAKTQSPRFYLLGGCDVGAILHRPRQLTVGEGISHDTPIHRQYGANMLALSYLMHAQGLAVLAHNVTNPPSDYGALYAQLKGGRIFGEAVLALLNDENDRGLPHYRNILFGDPTLRLSY